MTTPVTNFGKVTVSTGYDASATSIVLATGHGSRLPSTFPFPLTWWHASTHSDASDDPNREIVLVTNRTGDTLTVTRAQEGTAASTKNTAGTYKMVLGITKAMWDALGDLSLAQTFRGLSLQTHPDSDKALSQVRLVHADAIVMNDGEEVPDWNNVDFNIAAAAGIGGLDTGSEQPSTLYEIYAMWNGTTKGLMGHRAKNWRLDASYVAGEDASQGLRSAVDNSTVRIGQGLQFVTAGPLTFVDIKVLKTGSPTGNYWLELYTNNAGVPGTLLATSRKMNVARLTTTATFVRMVFPDPFSVSAATQYHLVLQGDYAVSAANFMSWRMDGSAGAYASGSKALYDSDTATWTVDTDDDMMFRACVEENNTALTIPAGYRYALIHPGVVNNASSHLKPFVQRDRTVHCGFDDEWQVGALAAAVALVDLFTFVPPCSVSVGFIVHNASGSNAAIGTLATTDLNSAAGTEIIGTWRTTLTAAFTGNIPFVPVEYQGIMFDSSAGTANLYIGSFTF